MLENGILLQVYQQLLSVTSHHLKWDLLWLSMLHIMVSLPADPWEFFFMIA